jgi:hypothetical protein
MPRVPGRCRAVLRLAGSEDPAYRSVPVVFLLLLALLACRGPVRPHTALAAHVDPLRADFNRDIGHVRIVTLVAPT